MDLSSQQKRVLFYLVEGVKKGENLQTLGGYAGTGKTTLIRYLTQFYPNFKVCAYTGKAANVLRKKGIDASTIHSLIYRPEIVNGVLVGFDLADSLDADGIIVDEASMVSKDIFYDLESFKLPMIFVGDHGQLEPIGADFNLMQHPDYTLEEIHRNANDIAKFAEHIRKGFTARSFRGTQNRVIFMDRWNVTDQYLTQFNQVICAYNKTRVDTNNRIRTALGHSGLLNRNERIMCLKNNKKLELFNGMQGIVRNIYKKHNADVLDFEFDNILFSGLKYDKRFFGVEKPDLNNIISSDGPNPFDYAYCITAHKAQGDEWDTGLVIEQKSSMWDHRRWAYTAASRFKEQVVWVSW